MGKAGKWFRSLLFSRKSLPESTPLVAMKKKSKWSLAKPSNERSTAEHDPLASPYVEALDANKHAIAVAAATAAVAEAALAAAQAAAEVVRLTSGGGSGRGVGAYIGRGGGDRQRLVAATRIQSAFRAYLARRALKALKGLVKLQALVRGHIVRKQSADMLRRMQAMARIQARASAHRVYISDPSSSTIESSNALHPKWSSRLQNGNNIKMQSAQLGLDWLDRWTEECTWRNRKDTVEAEIDDERGDKILEIDTWKPHSSTGEHGRIFQASQYLQVSNNSGQDYTRYYSSSINTKNPNPSISSEDVSSTRSLKVLLKGDPVTAWNAESSPQMHSASSRPSSSRRGPFTPTRTDCSRSLFGDYPSHPNYMANTQSSRAKVRCQSAPRQRMPSEDIGVGRNFSCGFWGSDTKSEKNLNLNNKFKDSNHIYSSNLNRSVTRTHEVASGYGSMYRQMH